MAAPTCDACYTPAGDDRLVGCRQDLLNIRCFLLLRGGLNLAHALEGDLLYGLNCHRILGRLASGQAETGPLPPGLGHL